MGRFLLLFSFLIFFLFTTTSFADEPAGQVKSISKDSSDVLTALSARIKDKMININWRISNPKDISFFEIQKHDAKTVLFKSVNREKIKRSDYIEDGVDENNFQVYKYNYADDPGKDGVYFYRIKGFSTSGKLLFTSEEIKIGVNGLRDFSLDQNRPNPFNPSTDITYELSSQTHVSLKVYDLLGREVATLVDQSQGEGEYTVEFDASKYPNMTSGIYFYKLETDKYSEVKKMILAK